MPSAGSRRNNLLIITAICVAAALFGWWALRQAPAGRKRAVDPAEVLARMTLEQKVGQMVLAGFPGYELATEADTLVRQYCLGGVMLASRNIKDVRQTTDLAGRLQKLAAGSCAGVPLFVAADQEGGYVVRLRGPYRFPGNMALGAAGDAELARQVGQAMGGELKAAGINMDFAPVLDVNSNPANPVIGVRSFGERPEAVAELGVAFIAGLHEAGVMAAAKHFPGHGDTAQDSHIALPSVPHSRARLDKVELLPFRQAIAAGVDAIMTAHVTFPAIEPAPGVPATLSEKVLTGLLRQELGYGGLIITDAMEMKAIVDNFGLPEAAVRAIQAGADIVLVAWPADWQQALRVVEAVVAAVRNGTLAESRIDASVLRILTAKVAAGLWENGARARPLSKAEQRELAAVSAAAAARSITLVRDEKQRLPLGRQGEKVLVITPELGNVTGAEDTGGAQAGLAQALGRHIAGVGEASMPAKPDKTIRERLVAQAREYDTVVVATYYAWAPAYVGQAELVLDLVKAGKEPVVVALREPYDLLRFPAVGTYLAAFSANPESLAAVADVLAGREKAAGRLPVSLPGLYAVGYGL